MTIQESPQRPSTPLSVVANVSRIVTRSIDRLTGDRSEVPLLVGLATQYALQKFSIQSQLIYGAVAYLERLENDSLQWAGCWGESFSFWNTTAFGELVDLNASVSFRKRDPHSKIKAIQSPPLLWCSKVPTLYRYKAEGIAQVDRLQEKDFKLWKNIQTELDEKCLPTALANDEEFPNEPIFGPNFKCLDDSKNSFKDFDRLLAVFGIPQSPF